MRRSKLTIIFIAFLVNVSAHSQNLEPKLLAEMISLSTPVIDMSEEELRGLAVGNTWYEEDPSSYDEHGLRLLLTDFGLDLAKIISTHAINTVEDWNAFSLEQKSLLLLNKDDYYLTPFDNTKETLVYSFDLEDLTGRHPSNQWPLRLAEEKISKIKEYSLDSAELILEKLINQASLDLEYSGYYPGMDDENVPLGTIGDWHVSSHVVISLKNGSTIAHEITIVQDGFMRWGDDQVFNPAIAEHYETLEEAISAGGTESDVCWSFHAIFDANLKEFIHTEELPFWCGF